jgi:hypothetical protein
MLAQHSSLTNEHYSPPELCNLARAVFDGPIHLDPFSSLRANRLVRAEEYYTERDNGFALPWRGNVWVNAPGGSVRAPDGRKASQPALAWAYLSSQHEAGSVKQACFLAFNLELFRHAQAWPVRQPFDHSVCIFRHRIAYCDQEGAIQESPPHPSALVYLGPHVAKFRATFTREGPFAGYVSTRFTRRSRAKRLSLGTSLRVFILEE